MFATRGGSTPARRSIRRPHTCATSSRFLGIDDVEFVYAEGLAISDASKAAALSRAERTIERLAAPERLAA